MAPGAAALMGLLALFVLGAAAFAVLVRLGVGRPLWPIAAAALLIGGTGYALQGSPMLPASPARPPASGTTDDPALIALRAAMPGVTGPIRAVLAASDRQVRAGDDAAAARLLLADLQTHPGSAVLWTALGLALAGHGTGDVPPPALFAFQQAFRLAPGSPAPFFALGLAEAQSGDLASARTVWRRALALSPADAPYRVMIAERLVILDHYLGTSQPVGGGT